MNKTIKVAFLQPVQHDGVEYRVDDVVEMPQRQAEALVLAAAAIPADRTAAKALVAADTVAHPQA